MPDPSALIPLKPTVLQILLSLADTERHGYGIIKEVHARTEGRVRLKPGAFYRLLARALDEGLVTELDEPPPHAGRDARRRYYAISEFGRRVARAELRRMSELMAQGEMRGLA